MSASRILGLMIVSLWLAAGCSGAKIDVGGSCVLNSDCNQGLVCTWGKCHEPCDTSVDCPTGESCITASDQSKVCQLPIETHCLYDSDCPTSLKCAVDQRCHNQCQTNVDCLSGQTCTTTKTCAEPNQVDSNNNLIGTEGGVGGCPVGSETCPCYPNDTCNTGLTCASHLCVNLGAGGSADAGMPADVAAPTDAVSSTTNVVTFSNGKAQGAMTGWAEIALGLAETVTDPVCEPSGVPPTSAVQCALGGTRWNAPDSLCLSGTVPAVPIDQAPSSWGMGISVYADESGGVVGRSYSTIAFSISGIPPEVLALGQLTVSIHRKGDPAGAPYATRDTGLGQPIPLTSFNTAWWDNSGTWFTAADAANIAGVEIDVASTTQQTFVVNNLCLNRITFQ